MELKKKEKLNLLRSSLESERSTFMPTWREVAEYILPRRPQFTVTDTNKGDRRNQKIIDSTATLAARTLRSGMMGGVTSPARPWFRLTTPDPALAEFQPVKEWLHTVTERMKTIMLRSNLYNALPTIYGDIGVFATAALGIEEDDEDVIRCYPFPIGSYMMANNDKMKVDVFFREFRLTVRQLIDKFGDGRNTNWDNFSVQIKSYYDRSQYEAWIDVCHVIQPNLEWDPENPFSKKFESLYYEKNTDSSEEKYLREKGYPYFPVLCPRWEVTGEDVYGTECPGIQVIGDVKALQLLQKRKAQAIEKMINPPMVAPAMMKTQKATILPGDITYVDEREGQKGFRPAHEVKLSISEVQMSINEHQQRISRAFYEDLFLMLVNLDRRQITAREIEERHEEKLLALGPVLEQLNQDLLDPLIDITFDIMVQRGMIPDPPEELQGMPLKVEYISIMAQAQKLVGIGGIERFAGFVGSLTQGSPEVLDKVDFDQMVDVYGDITSIAPSIIRADEVVAEIRQARAEEVQRRQQAEDMQKMLGAIKDIEGSAFGPSALMPESQVGQIVEVAP